jgi:hypothetical protein
MSVPSFASELLRFVGAQALLVQIAFWSTAALLLACGATLAEIALSEYGAARRERRVTRFRERYEPLLHAASAGDPVEKPALKRGELTMMLELWYHVAGYLAGEGREALVRFARAVDLDAYVVWLLTRTRIRDRSGDVWLKLLAIRAAEILKTRRVWSAMLIAADSDDSTVSLAAITALVRLDAEASMSKVVEVLLRYDNWAPYLAARVIEAGGRGAIVALAQLIANPPEGKARNLISLAESANDPILAPIVRVRLNEARDPEEIAALIRALKRLGDAEDRGLVRPLLTHASWIVRLQAVKCIGALGDASDRDTLAAMLSDPEWWVRYRAAGAIVRLPGVTADDVDALVAQLSDRFGRDILAQARAELAES